MILLPAGDVLSMGMVMMKAISLCNSNTVNEMSRKSDIETDRSIKNPAYTSLPSPLCSCLPCYHLWVLVPLVLLALVLHPVLQVSS